MSNDYLKETWGRTDAERSARNSDRYGRLARLDAEKTNDGPLSIIAMVGGVVFWIAFVALLGYLMHLG